MPTPLAYGGNAIPSQVYPGQTLFRFSTPVARRRMRTSHPLFSRMSLNEGLAVLKMPGGSYITTENPSEDQINSALIVYIGGRQYLVSPAEADALTAAGYEVTT